MANATISQPSTDDVEQVKSVLDEIARRLGHIETLAENIQLDSLESVAQACAYADSIGHMTRNCAFQVALARSMLTPGHKVGMRELAHCLEVDQDLLEAHAANG